MCLAIAPNQKLNNGYFNRIWRIVSSTPLRLFSFCVFIHSPVLGYLLTWLPKKYSLTPIHYGQYNVIYLFVMIGLGALEVGIFFSNNWVLAGKQSTVVLTAV